jgi:Uma2 family endonuclease
MACRYNEGMAIPVVTKISPEEYLERERKAEYKSEYWHGEVFAMSGAVANHVLICTNLNFCIEGQLRNSSCYVFGPDMKVGLTKKRGFSYPDLSIVCGEPRFYDDVQDVLMNPVVILEVLSNSTRDFDLGSKFLEYKRLPSLKHYVTIEQYIRFVGHNERQSDGSWRNDDLTGEDDVLRLHAVGIEVPLSEIYHRIELAPAETGP